MRTITITRTGGSAGAVGVTFATSNGTATAGSDYTATTQTVSFASGDTANKTVSVPITDDTSVEGNETVKLTLSNPTGGATLGNPSTAVLTITDNDTAADTSLSASPTTIAPGGTVTATWSGIAAPSARDWIGLYTPGAANTTFIEWIYVSCSKIPSSARASGSCPFAVPSTVAPGNYQLRLFANDGFSILATSNALTVQ
jgi:Calx-beta domain